MFETLAEFNGNAPATPESVSECERGLSSRLPEDYVSFLRHYNGGEGFIGGESYLILWAVEELIPFNRDYEVALYCPELLLFGSSGGGEAYAFHRRATSWRVVQVPFVGMDYSLCESMGDSFTEFIEKLAKKEEDL